MARGARTLARFGLLDTDAVRAGLRVLGLVADGPTSDALIAAAAADSDPQAVLFALGRAGRPQLAVRRLADMVTALRTGDGVDSAPAEASTDAPADLGTTALADPAADFLDTLRTDAAFRARLVGLVGASEPLGEHLVAHPREWQAIAADEPFADATSYARCLGALDAATRGRAGARLSARQVVAPLRIAYRTRLAVIAAADVAPAIELGRPGPTVAEVGQALSALADALLETALAVARDAHPSRAPVRFAVVAMGKCGARELNYVSDVDVLFVASARPANGNTIDGTDSNADNVANADNATNAGDTNNTGGSPAPVGPSPDTDPSDESTALRTATRWATELMSICRQVAWDVDAALRPEGGAGPLVRTIAGYRGYYQRWAKTWEFQALLKARPAAGDKDLGDEFLAVAQPEVWAAAGRADFVADVQAMRRRVRDAVPMPERDRELKLGAGGLRDVEFAVQLLQMVHGRTDETLRRPDTLTALETLTAGGYVGRVDGAELARAYEFERRVEHLVQLQHLLRTHSLPAGQDDLEWLARTAGFAIGGSGTSGPATGGPGVDGAARHLAAELARHGAVVRRLHEKLFYRPLLAAVAAVPADGLRLTTDEAAARLGALGFLAPGGALRHIAALTDGVSRRAAIQRTLLPVLLGMFADAPDPDMGLLGYRTVSDALADTPWYLRLLRDEGLVAERLAALLGTSRLVADLLQRAPEVLRLLAADADLAGPESQATEEMAASALLARAARARTPVAAAAAARSARRHEMLRLACADLLGLVPSGVVASGLTSVADATVQAALAAAHRQAAATSDEPPSARVAVIAMGRFGGAEMGYSSDADALFVAAPAWPGADPAKVLVDGTAIADITTRLLGRPSPDPALLIDADLRPEGRSGPLVRTVESYAQYWQRNVRPWERQALLRARLLGRDGSTTDEPAGDTADNLAEAFVRAVDPIRYPDGGLSPADVREIRRIKARVDTERLPRGADRTLHTKLGRGGLADVEWTVQLLQLEHAHRIPALKTTGTIPAIHAAVDAGLIDADAGRALIEGWTMASRARNAIMLVTGKPGDEIPAHGRVLAGIARACGYPADTDPGEFVDDYRRATRHARHAVDVLFDRV
ncbi:MAG: bifunctional glutamine-synthetase adenylyltransferase/deadenyltransferase [Actinobacteria bacterium 69-20]|jgi:glutamate-ammonia-ligase adenylyltransferase|nr:bifunctional [glutamine synthetase] adenylyltransferase/[glutamine synthetase]-adenylyl-L-tyrosine phosphorylase [Actinomycetota bacterium]OJV31337.1 MAG: bifunctional glutamine-synthetase adenylyltransferase/deadenyltransferase [Actinobacteria bacterium 69-20]